MARRTRSRKSKVVGTRLPRQSHNAQRNYERYVELARAEALKGDLIAAENYLQHAEHYLRSMHDEAHGGRLSSQSEIRPKQRLRHSG
ncbi:DUF4167 domain-containing protein [Bradyrhizobium sp. WSM 1738]|uniref:DUF4167 domain-containing protein n=1 Tax=Bradyrhizobium hereditatis TaxID=2821405 RepID=UPI001CE2E3E4|nr:DUF4167 domain-containing protein [Bradyrhizobium hereditatis]MCA6115840.1 DUF4167 domain-containing protein [Bradyrhizobium hereditatis]